MSAMNKSKIEAQLDAAREAAGLDILGIRDNRRVVFLDPDVRPVNEAQETAFRRLEAAATDVINLPVMEGSSVKEEIAKRVNALSGNVRYVYVGLQPLEDFRCVVVDRNAGLSEWNVDTAIKILH